MSINEVVYKALSSSESTGLATSSTANKLLEGLKPIYQLGNKEKVIEKIEQLKKEPGIPFPTNYRDILEQD